MNQTTYIQQTLNLSEKSVKNTIDLLEDGATVPFISRYRKERTGGLDEVQVTNIKDELAKWKDLEKRKETIIKAIKEQEKWDEEIAQKIATCFDMNQLEDIYLPFKKKKKTKASVARERGLEPLAKMIMSQHEEDVERLANRFVKGEVATIDDALAGARDIMAEWINERQRVRDVVRRKFQHEASVEAKVVKDKEEEGEKFKDYFNYQEPIKKAKPHRILALFRGENEGVLKLKIEPSEAEMIEKIEEIVAKGWNESAREVRLAAKDAYKRLLKPSIENEIRKELKLKADLSAIEVFSTNLRQLLLASPVGQKNVLAIDPGFRTGCKVVCLSQNGDLKHNETIFPHPPQKDVAQAKRKISSLVQQYKIEVIAIGNGTASRETENFIKNIRYDRSLEVYVVSEDGASIYSASKVAREEFPTYDVTVRGAVSIGRRLMDPLAELVKIDAKSIGVGQYQHDVDQKLLKQKLDEVVESCVNEVGVDVNTASKYILTYISGLGEQLATNIVNYRTENGPFKSRSEIKKVERMGAKSFEQAAGFLRISDGKNPLDNTTLHPENYDIAKQIAKDLKVDVSELIGNEKLKEVNTTKYQDEERGAITIEQVIKELAKPTHDPRKKAKVFSFSDQLSTINDVREGMEVPGIVTNITDFGAFVDIGIKENGLVHISQIVDEYIAHPSEKLSIHQHVKVKIVSVDSERKRIGLSMKF